jgi:hypothetical protein
LKEAWFKNSKELLGKDLDQNDDILWGIYHVACQPPAINVLLPLFYEKAATPAMIKHGLDVQRKAINFLNPGQTVNTLEDVGKRQYQQFVKTVIEERTQFIHKPIKRNNMALLKTATARSKSKKDQKIKILQSNVALFGKLYIAMQHRVMVICLNSSLMLKGQTFCSFLIKPTN